MMNKINSVCVYCASSTKIDSVYFDAARELGTLLGQKHIRLINGAGNMGRWVNNRKIFKTIKRFEDYDPKRG